MKAFSQLIFEITPLVSTGLLASFFIGNSIASNYGRQIFAEELLSLQTFDTGWSSRLQLNFFIPQVMALEEKMDAFQIELAAEVIGSILIVSFFLTAGVIFVWINGLSKEKRSKHTR